MVIGSTRRYGAVEFFGYAGDFDPLDEILVGREDTGLGGGFKEIDALRYVVCVWKRIDALQALGNTFIPRYQSASFFFFSSFFSF